jgi:DNA-binding CsgD family transcriptional regulator/predicted negative regulator of RcsB-dependent stress response
MHEGRLEQARTALERGALLVEKAGMLPTLLLPMGSLAELSIYDGHWDEAERLLRTTTSLLRERHGRAWPFAIDAAFLALVRWYRGDREEAAALLDEARQVAEARADAGSLTLLEMVLARMALAAGDPGQAQGILEGVLGRQGVEASHLADARLLLVEVYVASGQAERARAELEAVERQGYLPLLSARVERMRGRIASLRGDLDAAIEAYRSGTNILQRVRQPYEEAQMQRDLGRTLVRRGGRGDRREARSLLAAAAAGFEALGAGPDAALARQVMGRISGRRPSGGDLTEREREVLALLADGLSNAAIAARLYISERTVEVHVTHILAKLGSESRVQAAAWAAKHHHPSRPSAT